MTTVHRHVIDFLLASMFTEVGEDGMMHMFNSKGRTNSIGGIYVTVFFSHRRLVTAALFVREHGAPHLRDLSIDDISILLTDFMIENYPLISREVLFEKLSGSFFERVSEGSKIKLTAAMAASRIFTPPLSLALLPLVTVRVQDDFSSKHFFLRNPETLLEEFDPHIHHRIVPDTFPPVADWRYRKERPAAWLGVRSAAPQTSKKYSRILLGAAALTQSHTYRHMFSGRTMWGGHCIAEGGWPITFGSACTPPLAEDIVITDADHGWLSILADKVSSVEKTDRRQMTALQYFYRAWPLNPSERFPVLCMALDATYSEVGHATAAVIDGIGGTLGALDARRLRDLLEIRASVIHGGAPDVYESRKYGKYYRTYGDDPIRDMGLLVAACLRKKIFGDTLKEHEEPHAEIISQAQSTGRLPKVMPRSTILEINQDTASIS